jgi:ABC-type uncharacterized transport system permease subunit
MTSSLHIVQNAAEVFLPVLYVLSVLLYGLAFFRDDTFANRWKARTLAVTFALHFVYIGLHSVEHGRCMVTTPFEMMSLVAFTILTTYLIIERTTRISETGFFFAGIAAAFELVSAVMVKVPSTTPMNPALANLGIGLHVSAAIFGFGSITISAVYGLLYLLLYRDLKSGKFGSFYQHLPSLESLERLSTAAVVVGFTFLTVAICIGGFWLPRVFENFSYMDPKLLATGLVWLIYAGVLVAKYIVRIDGRRVVTLSMSGFVLAVLSMTIVNAFLSSFHRFYR